ncbi:hypothetical protein L211DRAFT_372693 [Terfezia boudieri ATCC MYA-4762]|uniref:Uncharacterized protein n=1 Tax=Terfezia boudieri ATCC MYA-4762 TaxID=1051890 RepID=A0A3N4LZN8_9PEZI|nr:hypothetical protein L211DRAFT_372693 [Terfezia boudieri ATCC MYA-4762]
MALFIFPYHRCCSVCAHYFPCYYLQQAYYSFYRGQVVTFWCDERGGVYNGYLLMIFFFSTFPLLSCYIR